MNEAVESESPSRNRTRHINRLKAAAAVLTCAGIGLFVYFIYSVGLTEVVAGVSRIGAGGFAFVLLIYFLRICIRATTWKLSVFEPYKLRFRDTLPAVIIGEALSSVIPLGILVSGTSKAIAVRKRVPLVVGLSSVATENLFYSLVTSLFILLGAFVFLRSFELEPGWVLTIDLLIGGIFLLLAFGFLLVLRQWHIASAICERLYDRGFATSVLGHGRHQVRLFENLIFGFYRQYPGRFLPIVLLQVLFHLLGVVEVLFVLGRISDAVPSMMSAFLLESVSRLITIVFKLVPFLIGVDEAGAQFVTETLAIGAGVGLSIAIIRKGRILFWAVVGVILIAARGISPAEIRSVLRRAVHPD